MTNSMFVYCPENYIFAKFTHIVIQLSNDSFSQMKQNTALFNNNKKENGKNYFFELNFFIDFCFVFVFHFPIAPFSLLFIHILVLFLAYRVVERCKRAVDLFLSSFFPIWWDLQQFINNSLSLFLSDVDFFQFFFA